MPVVLALTAVTLTVTTALALQPSLLHQQPTIAPMAASAVEKGQRWYVVRSQTGRWYLIGASLRLWNRPVDAAFIPGAHRRAEQLSPAMRVRMVLAPGVAWGEVQDLVFLLETTRLDVELQLPPAACS